MPVAVKRPLHGGLYGLLVALACEAVRYGLGERRSFADMAAMLVALIVVGAVSAGLRGKARNARQPDRGGAPD